MRALWTDDQRCPRMTTTGSGRSSCSAGSPSRGACRRTRHDPCSRRRGGRRLVTPRPVRRPDGPRVRGADLESGRSPWTFSMMASSARCASAAGRRGHRPPMVAGNSHVVTTSKTSLSTQPVRRPSRERHRGARAIDANHDAAGCLGSGLGHGSSFAARTPGEVRWFQRRRHVSPPLGRTSQPHHLAALQGDGERARCAAPCATRTEGRSRCVDRTDLVVDQPERQQHRAHLVIGEVRRDARRSLRPRDQVPPAGRPSRRAQSRELGGAIAP